MSTQMIVIAGAFLVVGWVLHMLWDAFLDWLFDATGWVSSILWDVFAVLGIIAVCVAIGFGVMHHQHNAST